jgi:hypothetical protein
MDPIGPNSNRDGDGVASTEVNRFVVREQSTAADLI